MVKEFYDQYFPYGKISLVKKEIGEFRVGESEILWQAWRRYQDLLLKCPQHGLSDDDTMQNFYT